MAINLDDKVKNVEQVIIGGKQRKIIFNDDFNKKVSDVQLSVGKIHQRVTDLDPEESKEMSLDDQKAFISDQFDSIADAAINFFDEQFGNGAGKEIYGYYQKSSDALAIIIGELYKLSNDIVVKSKKNAKNKKKQHYVSNN